MANILLIDDDVPIGQRLTKYFRQFGLELTCATHPIEGLQQLQDENFDLLILDIMMPEMNGMDVCKTIRQLPGFTSDIPIIMLSARGDVMDRVIGIEIGADDYLPKPFEPRELVVRIQAILKRRTTLLESVDTPDEADTLSYDRLRIELASEQVFLDEKEVILTSSEYRLLEMLAKEPDRQFNRDEIINQLKGIDAEDLYSRSVDNLVSRLRSKLKPGDYIKTVWGRGYRFSKKSQ